MKKIILQYILFYISYLLLFFSFNAINNMYEPLMFLGFYLIFLISISYIMNKKYNYKTENVSVFFITSLFFSLICMLIELFYKILPYYKNYTYNNNKFYLTQTAQALGFEPKENNLFNIIFFFMLETMFISLFYFITFKIIIYFYEVFKRRETALSKIDK